MEDLRYHSLDKLKVMCAFLVVCIHAPFPGVFGEYLMPLTRIAVPVFFMISGFFWKRDNGKKQICKLLKFLIIANVLYFAFDLAKSIGMDRTTEFLKNSFTWGNLLKFVLLNESPFAPHLWYLGAIIYVLLAYRIIDSFKLNYYFLLYAALLLLIVDLLFGKYSILVFHREFPYLLIRNWLFVGLPNFVVGKLIREKRDSISKYIRPVSVIGGSVFFSLTSLLGKKILVYGGLNAKRDSYISTFFLSLAVFLMFLEYVDNRDSFVSKIGRKDSIWIYIFHYMFIGGLGFIARIIGLGSVFDTIRAVIIFIVTTGVISLIDKLLEIAMSKMFHPCSEQ